MIDFEKIRATIRSSEREMVELQKILSSIPALSPENGGDGEEKKCRALEKWLLKNGFSDLSHYDAKDERVSSGIRPNLIATISGKKDDFAIWVMAHLDVVPPGNRELWESDPWTVRETADGRLIARGVEDNQQGLVSAVFASLALLKNKTIPERTVHLLFMADEECGSEFGVKFLLKEHRDLFKKDDVIIIPDGGDPKGETIEIAEKGILWLRVKTTGAQAHGSMPNRGKNAHLAAATLALKLNDLENVFCERDDLFFPPYSTFQPTKHESNVDGVNIIPGNDVFYMDCRVLPRYSLSEVRKKIDERVLEVCQIYGVKIEVEEIQHEQSPATKSDSRVVRALSRAIKNAHAQDSRCVGIGGGTVGAHFRAIGIDAAIWSTLDEMCHQPNEYCKIENMIRDAETLAMLFLQE